MQEAVPIPIPRHRALAAGYQSRGTELGAHREKGARPWGKQSRVNRSTPHGSVAPCPCTGTCSPPVLLLQLQP